MIGGNRLWEKRIHPPDPCTHGRKGYDLLP